MRRSVFASIVVSAAVGMAHAQSTATLTGVVTDPTGAVLPGAAITIRGLDTGLDRTLTTDSGGVYTAPSLQPGPYSIQITSSGFGSFSVQRVVLLVDQTTSLNAKLTLGSSAQTVEVESTAPIVDSDTITVGTVIDQQTVQNIPLNGRHFLDLTNLTPGTVVPPVTGSLTVPSRGLGANSFNTAGAREDAVNFMVNGINLNDMSQNQITFQPSIDTTAEFKLDNSTYSAEYGRNSGAVVNVLTRSGTNDFHGNAFDYYRDQYFDARNYFNFASQNKNTFRRQNYGADVSGPIRKDKAFLFLSYEALRQEQGLLFTHTVLTAAQRAALAASPAGPAYAQLLNLIPVANNAAGTVFSGASSAPVRVDQFSGDLLDRLGAKDTLHLYYAWQQDRRTEPNLQGNNIPGFGDHRTAHRQIGTVNEVHVLSPNAVNEARVGFSRIAISFVPNFAANAATYGISAGNVTGLALPQITLSDIGLNFGGPNGFPQGRFDTTGVFSDTLTLTRGKHTIRTGGEYRRFIYSSFTNNSGTINFPTTAAFIAGDANSFSVTPQEIFFRAFNTAVGGFIDDKWKVTPRLLLETGFRLEWNGTPVDAKNRFVNFIQATDSLQTTHVPFDQSYNFEPRVGFTYDAFGNGKTILRSAFGILTDEPTDSVDTGLAGNPPNATPVTVTGASLPVANLYVAGTSVAPNAVNPHFRDAYTESYNVNLEQQLKGGVVMKAGYIGSAGKHLRLSRNINQFSVLGTTARPYQRLSATTGFNQGEALGNITYQDSDSVSNYNALWLTMQKNLGHGLQFLGTYTYAKSMDINSLAGGGLQDNTNPAGNYGLSDFDVRHHFVVSGTYTLPFHQNRFVDGFLLAVINQEQTGNPMNVLLSNTTYTGTATLRPTVLNRNYSTGRGVTTTSGLVPFVHATVCGTPTASCNFYVQPAGFGNLQRNSLTGPAFEDTDMSLQKTTKIAERLALVLRVDTFDIFNHVNFSNPNLTATTSATSTFGLISATRAPIGDAGSARQLQLAAKIVF
ncbi:MAG: carboxypeptidase regulatory-like domain-containing protein [Janthinobacterium lividum]